jgi:hypothetical protein
VDAWASSVAVHSAMARVAGVGISLPWASRAGWVTKSELDVWTWRSWKVLFGVQSTAYAGFAFDVPEAADGTWDLMQSLAYMMRRVCAWKRQVGAPTAEGWARL